MLKLSWVQGQIVSTTSTSTNEIRACALEAVISRKVHPVDSNNQNRKGNKKNPSR